MDSWFRKASLFSILALLFFSFAPSGYSETAKKDQLSSALNANNYIRTKKILKAAINKPIPEKSEEAKSWYRALFALITLERLVGSQKQALLYFSQCGVDKASKVGCEDIASTTEWRSMRDWACQSEPLPEPCVKPIFKK